MGGETICPPPMDLRPSADGSAVRTSLVASGGFAAGSQRAYSPGGCAMGQTDGRIALCQNSSRAGGHNDNKRAMFTGAVPVFTTRKHRQWRCGCVQSRTKSLRTWR